MRWLRIIFLCSLHLGVAQTLFAESEFTFEDLQRLISEKKISTIEELLPQLPEEFRRNYVLMHKSSSLQPASYEAPRVISFGKDAKLILAFNGDPKLSNREVEKNPFNQLEIIQWRKESSSFEFRNITFVPQTTPKVSEANPARCTHCHTQDLRPNWEHYNFWPGAYGALDDTMGNYWPEAFKTQRSYHLKQEEVQNEMEGFRNFLSSRVEHPRYKHLSSPATFYSTGDSDSSGDGELNAQFGMLVQNLNNYRIVRLMQAEPHYSYLKFAIAAILSDSPMIQSKANEIPDLKKLKEQLLSTSLGQSGLISDLPSIEPIPFRSRYRGYGPSDLLIALYEKVNVPIKSWSTDFHSKNVAFSEDGVRTPLGLLATLIESDAELKEFFILSHEEDGEKTDYLIPHARPPYKILSDYPLKDIYEGKIPAAYSTPLADKLISKALERKKQFETNCDKKNDFETILEFPQK